jgi:hypothetical protein
MFYDIKNVQQFITQRNEMNKQIFSIKKYSESLGHQFKNTKVAHDHWCQYGKKKGLVYTDCGKNTLIGVICPTFNESVLLEPFIKYYSKLVGIENVYFIDNNSTLQEVDEIFKKYNVTVFKSDKYFDTNYNIDFNNLANYLSGEYKFLTKIDTDEFIAYTTSNDVLNFDNSRFTQFLKKCNTHIATYWVPNVYTEEINNNVRDINAWKYFEYVKSKSNIMYTHGKSIYNNNMAYHKRFLAMGNHNSRGILKMNRKKYTDNNVVCLHMSGLDIIGRLNNNINILKKNYYLPPEFTDVKNVTERAIECLKDIELNGQTSRHKSSELLEYFGNPDQYIGSKIRKDLSNCVMTDIISKTINQ